MSEDDFYFLLSISQWGWNLGYIEWYFNKQERPADWQNPRELFPQLFQS